MGSYIRHFLEGILRWPKPMTSIFIHCDSQSAIGKHKIVYTMVSLDIFIIDTRPLDNYSQLELYL